MKIRAPGFRIGASFGAAFSPDGEHLAVVGRTVVLWSVSRRERLRPVRVTSHPAAVAFSPDGSQLVVKNTGGRLILCDTATAAPVARFFPAGHDEGPGPVYAADGRIVDGSWDGEIRVRGPDLRPDVVWRGAHCMVAEVMQGPGVWAFGVGLTHAHPAFEAGGDEILVGSTLDALRPLERRWRFLRGAALSPSGDRLAVRSGRNPSVIEVIDLGSGRRISAGATSTSTATMALCWSPDGAVLVLMESDGFSFRDASDLREIGWLPSAFASGAWFSPDGRLVALGDWKAGVVTPWPPPWEQRAEPSPSAPL